MHCIVLIHNNPRTDICTISSAVWSIYFIVSTLDLSITAHSPRHPNSVLNLPHFPRLNPSQQCFGTGRNNDEEPVLREGPDPLPTPNDTHLSVFANSVQQRSKITFRCPPQKHIGRSNNRGSYSYHTTCFLRYNKTINL